MEQGRRCPSRRRATSPTSTRGWPRRGCTTSATTRYVASDTGGGPFARQWVTAKAGLRRPRLPEGDRLEPADGAAQDGLHARDGARVEDPAVVQRDRAPAGAQPTTRPTRRSSGCTTSRRRWSRCAPAARRAGTTSRCPTRPSASGFHEAARGVLSHHMVIRDGQDRQLPALPADAVERATRATPTARRGPTRTPCRTRRSSRRTARTNFKGIDIMRAVHSFDPCLPCGVHMYGKGKVRKVVHTPDRHVLSDDGPRDDTGAGARRQRPGADGAPRRGRRPEARDVADELAARSSRCTATGSGGSSPRWTARIPAARPARSSPRTASSRACC